MAATDQYFQAVGKAIWEFTSLEWNVVCVLRKLWPDYVSERYRLPKRPQASRIATDLRKTVDAVITIELQTELSGLADAFEASAIRRNDLVHGAPATVAGEQILARMTENSSIHWTTEALHELGQEFSASHRMANRVLHSDLLDTHGPIGNWKDRFRQSARHSAS